MGLDKSLESAESPSLKRWLIPAIFVAVALLIMLFGELGKEAMRYDRVWIAQGETWRLLSGHFAHLSWMHLVINSVGLLLVWFLVGRNHSLRHWLIIVALTIAFMDSAFWFLSPELYWYVGMSGMLHGLLAAGLVARFPDIDTETIILVLLMVAKIGWEQWNGPVPGSETTSGGPVVVDAHLYGAVGGAMAALLMRIRVKTAAAI
jgi:rhomboid family GlyGly-CTERM serine protease